jgi:hypothetical protein
MEFRDPAALSPVPTEAGRATEPARRGGKKEKFSASAGTRTPVVEPVA